MTSILSLSSSSSFAIPTTTLKRYDEYDDTSSSLLLHRQRQRHQKQSHMSSFRNKNDVNVDVVVDVGDVDDYSSSSISSSNDENIVPQSWWTKNISITPKERRRDFLGLDDDDDDDDIDTTEEMHMKIIIGIKI